MTDIRKYFNSIKIPIKEFKSNKQGYEQFIVHNYIIKKIDKCDLIGESFFLKEDIGIIFLRNATTFQYGKHLYQLIPYEKDFKYGDYSALKKITNLYTKNDRIVPMMDFQDIKQIYENRLNESKYALELYDFITNKYISNVSFNKCTKGFFHGDLHYENIVTKNKKVYLMDFDNACNSYSLLNLTYLYFTSYIWTYVLNKNNNQRRLASETKKYLISMVKDNDLPYFDYMVYLCMGLYILQNIDSKDHTLNDLISKFEKYVLWSKMIDMHKQ